ncbi:MAG: hypothetical protein ACFB6S_13280 [Geminicoccaceae bacterium]
MLKAPVLIIAIVFDRSTLSTGAAPTLSHVSRWSISQFRRLRSGYQEENLWSF